MLKQKNCGCILGEVWLGLQQCMVFLCDCTFEIVQCHGIYVFLTYFYSIDCLAILKERITKAMLIAAALGFLGVFCVAKPDQGLWNWVSAIGIASSLLASMAFVTVRALTKTEPPERIVFYFCLIGSVLSAIPMFWVWRPNALKELFFLLLQEYLQM